MVNLEKGSLPRNLFLFYAINNVISTEAERNGEISFNMAEISRLHFVTLEMTGLIKIKFLDRRF